MQLQIKRSNKAIFTNPQLKGHMIHPELSKMPTAYEKAFCFIWIAWGDNRPSVKFEIALCAPTEKIEPSIIFPGGFCHKTENERISRTLEM